MQSPQYFDLEEGEEVPISRVLSNLQKHDDRFESWLPWMIPGAKFKTGSGTVYQIFEIDEYGNFDCLKVRESTNLTHSFRCDLVAKQTPID